MACRIPATSLFVVLLLSACGAPQREQVAEPPGTTPIPPAQGAAIPAFTLDGYKRDFARKIAASSTDIFSDPMPEMLRSIVVVDVTIDRNGQLLRATIRRSNGIKVLENRALESVRRAAPYQAPAFTVRRSDGSVNFLETFLFRDDGRFRILSLQQD
jgi:protein TonB